MRSAIERLRVRPELECQDDEKPYVGKKSRLASEEYKEQEIQGRQTVQGPRDFLDHLLRLFRCLYLREPTLHLVSPFAGIVGEPGGEDQRGAVVLA